MSVHPKLYFGCLRIKKAVEIEIVEVHERKLRP